MASKRRKKVVLKSSAPKSGRPARLAFNGAVYKQPDMIVEAKTKRTLLIDAIIKGDDTRVERLLASGASPGKCDILGKTPLHYAAQYGRLEAIEKLAKAGASLNARDKFLCTSLFAALQSPQPVATAKLLLSLGADANIPDRHSCLPLHAVAAVGDEALTALFVAATENISYMDDARCTPFHEACKKKNSAAVRVLLEARANLLCADKDGNTPLHYALLQKDFKTVAMILSKNIGPLVNTVNLQNQSPLYLGVLSGDIETVRMLLKKGANVNMIGEKGFSPLALAAAAHPLLVPVLVKAGADVSYIPAEAKTTPLIEAIGAKNIAGMKFLLDHGADPNAANANQDTPIIAATRSGCSPESLKVLLEAGADPNQYDREGINAWHHACRFNRVDNIQMLLDSKKADIASKTKDGRNALYFAIQYNMRCVPIVALLLAAGLNPLEKDDSGDTPYDRARRIDNTAVCELFDKKLKEKGISYTPKDPPRRWWGPY